MLFSEEANKATEFIQLCNVYDLPIIFLHNVTGYMVGSQYEQGGIIKDGAKMINASPTRRCPTSRSCRGSYGAGNYGMSGQAYNPRFLFMWPSAKVSVMGGEQLAGVMSIVNRPPPRPAARTFDEDHDAMVRQMIETQINARRQAVFMTAATATTASSTRATPAPCSACPVGRPLQRRAGTNEWGIFRM